MIVNVIIDTDIRTSKEKWRDKDIDNIQKENKEIRELF